MREFAKFYSDIKRYHSLVGLRGTLWFLFDQGFWMLLIYRVLSGFTRTPFFVVAKILEKIVEFLSKNYLPINTEIGGGLIFFHAHGIIINGRVKIGSNFTCYARVCIGERYPGDCVPVLGSDVTVGTAACILGPVHVPSGVVIPANSLVTPRNCDKYNCFVAGSEEGYEESFE